MISRSLGAGIVAAAMLASPVAVHAADLPAPSYKAPAYVAPAYANWSGFYLGLNAGYGFGNSNWDFPVGTTPNPRGFLGGVTLGYNFQSGVIVYGIEGDIDYSAIKGTTPCGGATCETKNDYLGTARLRLGYGGWSNFLPYITGGAAIGDIKATNSAFGTATKTKLGYAVGAGLEYAFLGNWSVKAEYLYASLGSMDCAAACGGPGVTTDNVSFKTSIVRGGINYRF